MKVTKLPNQILREKAKEVILPLNNKTTEIINGMIDLIDKSQKKNSKYRSGIGIAAPQVGHSLRMFYVNVPENEELSNFKVFLINPEIIGYSEKKAALASGEGCLSIDFEDKSTEGLVHRHHKIIIKGYSFLDKKQVTITKTGYHAIVLQHEYDHLEGKLFIDRINLKNPWEKKDNEVLI